MIQNCNAFVQVRGYPTIYFFPGNNKQVCFHRTHANASECDSAHAPPTLTPHRRPSCSRASATPRPSRNSCGKTRSTPSPRARRRRRLRKRRRLICNSANRLMIFFKLHTHRIRISKFPPFLRVWAVGVLKFFFFLSSTILRPKCSCRCIQICSPRINAGSDS